MQRVDDITVDLALLVRLRALVVDGVAPTHVRSITGIRHERMPRCFMLRYEIT